MLELPYSQNPVLMLELKPWTACSPASTPRRDVDVTNGCKSSLWAPRILHNKARKLKRDNPRRAQLLSLLLKVAETAVAVPAAKELANTFASEACLNSVCEPETAVLFPKHSSVL